MSVKLEKKQLSPVEELQMMFNNEKLDIKQIKLQEYLQALKTMGVAKNLNVQQMYIFIKYCYMLKLNPLLKQIHCVTYKNRDGSTTMTPIISYSEYIKRAEKHPNYQLPEIKTIDRDENGKLLPLDQVYIIARVQRKGDTTSLEKVFYMSEWNKKTGEWLTKPKHMLYVRALKNILSIAYPNEIAEFELAEAAYEAESNEAEQIPKTKQMKKLLDGE